MRGQAFSLLARAHIVALVVVPLLGVLVVGAGQCPKRRASPLARPTLSDWQLPQLVECLNAHGMELRVVPVTETNTPPCVNSAFLTTTKQTWSDLTQLLKVTEKIDTWKGTLYCERLHQPNARVEQIEMWGDCCLVVGPFLFFGDRELLARVSAVLAVPGN
jgi:hypothetical protein